MSGPQLGNIAIGPQRTPWVIKQILIVTAAAFVVQALATQLVDAGGPVAIRWFGLSPERVLSGWIWQPLTWMLVHGDLGHLVGNLFFLWMFGSTVAEKLGTRRFLMLYVGGGAAVGVAIVVLSGLARLLGLSVSWLPWIAPTLGASGAVYAVVAVYSFRFPRQNISLLFVPFSFEARWMLPVNFLMEFGFAAGSVSHVAHVGGVVAGWLFHRFGHRLPTGSPRPPGRPKLRVVEPPLYH
jgi:membrane associated rhomboid family serine protease